MNKLVLLLLITILGFAQTSEFDFQVCKHAVAGDFHLKAQDTLKEDVSISGGNATIDGMIKGDLAVMGGSVRINGKTDGDVAVFGGEIENYGRITGDVAVAGGSIRNAGIIESDIAVAGGNVALDSGSIVAGDIAIVGGSVDRSDFAVVKGNITAMDLGKFGQIMPRIKPLLKLHQRPSPISAVFLGFAAIAFALVLFLINLLCLVIFPRAVEKISTRIQDSIWISVAIGIGLQILFVPLLLLFTLSIIGIPIIPAFVLAIFIATIFGLSAFALVLGERICLGLNWQVKNRIGVFAIGWIASMIILIIGILLKELGFLGLLVWIIGIAILYVAGTIGLGGVLYTLFRRTDNSKT